MVVFEADITNGGRKKTTELVKLLESRIRLTDVLGWTAKTEMGALLPDTHPDGARKFSEYVRYIMFDRCGEAPRCRVFSYPETLGEDRDDEDDRQLWFEGFDGQSSCGSGETLAKAGGLKVGAQASVAAKVVRQPAALKGEGWNIAAADGTVDEVVPPPPFTLKRMFDVTGAAIGLVLAAPVMLLAALLIKVVSPGPVFFKQDRVGYMGRIFTCLKFRTMHVNVDASGHQKYFSGLIKSAKPMKKLDTGVDPRLIPFARIIRLLAIDELPQLINVVRGDMSLIGPRPCIPYEYQEFSGWHRQRVHALPGMTGLWQVSGKNRTTFAEMMRLDISYARKRNVLFDCAICIKTIPAIFAQLRDGLISRSG